MLLMVQDVEVISSVLTAMPNKAGSTTSRETYMTTCVRKEGKLRVYI